MRCRVYDRRFAHVGEIDGRAGEFDQADHAGVVELVVISGGVGGRFEGDPLHHASVAQGQAHEHTADQSPVEQLPEHHEEMLHALRRLPGFRRLHQSALP
jgi:hypothetical protein